MWKELLQAVIESCVYADPTVALYYEIVRSESAELAEQRKARSAGGPTLGLVRAAGNGDQRALLE